MALPTHRSPGDGGGQAARSLPRSRTHCKELHSPAGGPSPTLCKLPRWQLLSYTARGRKLLFQETAKALIGPFLRATSASDRDARSMLICPHPAPPHCLCHFGCLWFQLPHPCSSSSSTQRRLRGSEQCWQADGRALPAQQHPHAEIPTSAGPSTSANTPRPDNPEQHKRGHTAPVTSAAPRGDIPGLEVGGTRSSTLGLVQTSAPRSNASPASPLAFRHPSHRRPAGNGFSACG